MPVATRRSRAVRRIQAWWRRCLALPRDPITLGLLRRPTVTSQGTVFGVDALREFVLHTGDTRHPVTRAPLSPPTLRVLGVRDADLEAPRRRAADLRERDALRAYLESEVTEHVAALARAVAGGEGPPMDVVEFRFPRLATAVADLGRAGGDVARVVGAASARIVHQRVPLHRLPLYMVVRGFLSDLS